jgi:hypothetical protein
MFAAFGLKPGREFEAGMGEARLGDREDRRTSGETRTILLAVAGGESSNPTPAWNDVPADLGGTCVDRLTGDLTDAIGEKK